MKLVLVSLCTAVTIGWAIWAWQGHQGKQKPNVLIVSTCSLRYKLLAEYNTSKTIAMPALDKFFRESSFIFSNAFNGIPWIAWSSYGEIILPAKLIEEYGYHSVSNTQHNYILRIPHRESWTHKDDRGVDDNDFEKNQQAEIDYLKSRILQGPRPFFAVAHFKYMHYPLIDRFNADSDWDHNLSEVERRRLSEFLNHPERYPARFPFLILLSNDARIALKHPLIRNLDKLDDLERQISLKGLLTDPAFLKDWKASPDFAQDLALLEKIYAANASYLDRVLKPILNLWDDRELQENTIVIFSGDHGELHMEHDILTHGSALFDDALKVPLAIRFPGQNQPVRIESQMHYRMLATLIKGMISGVVDQRNLVNILPRVNEEAMLLRDCLNRRRGLRVNNSYKYIFDVAADRASLFDLKQDPNETRDIASERPDLVEKFEKQFWSIYPQYTEVDPGSCFSWVKAPDG